MRIRIENTSEIRRSAGSIRAIVPQRVPAHITGGGFVDSSRDRRKIRRHMMLEAIFTNVVQKLLHLRNLDYAGAAKGVERIISEAAFANVAAHFPGGVIS